MSYLMSFSPFDVTKNFAVGVGIGVGLGVVIRRIIQEKTRQRDNLISCLRQLAAEVRQLRQTLIQSVTRQTKQTTAGDVSSDDDEFFDSERGEDITSESLEDFLAKIDRLQDGSSAEKQDAYNMLINKTNQVSDNCEIMWRYAKAQYQMSDLKEQAGDKDAQKFMNEKGIITAKAALKLDNENYRAHQWYGILLGNSIQFLDNKGKILAGYEYKEHIEKAIELNPTNATSYYLLGRYNFEIYMLPWYMRKAAAALFAEPPTATVDDALNLFLKAEELKPGFWSAVPLFIGKCYYQKSDYSNAKKWLRKAAQIKTDSKDDEKNKREALELLKKC